MLSGIVCKVGDERNAVVLHVDPVACCVQLTLNKDTIKAVRAFKENKFTQAGFVRYSIIHDRPSLDLNTFPWHSSVS